MWIDLGAARLSAFSKTARTQLKRKPVRGTYDRETIYAIIDEALICHIGFAVDGQPYVLPTGIARIDDALYIHGNRNSRMIRALESGALACITVTNLDGLVLARSGFHSSMNYRSVMIFGRAERVDGKAKIAALNAFIERLIPGRTADLRPHRPKELRATTVLKVPLVEVSAKIRTGPPIDDADDYELPVWAGVLPFSLKTGNAVPDPRMKERIPTPAYVSDYKR